MGSIFRYRWFFGVLALGWALAAGCADDGQPSGSDGGADAAGADGGGACAPVGTRRVVTADWLAQSLTVLSYTRLTSGSCTADESILEILDLSDYEPGPIELEVTPDGRTAVVAVGPGFFAGGLAILVGQTAPVPPGGTLLVVDLDTGSVSASLDTAEVPMGLAIAPDGSRAYTANYGDDTTAGHTLSIVDLDAPAVLEDVELGGRPEQVALSADGSVGMVNLTSGSVRVFQTSDVAGTLTDPVTVGTDPSDIAFVAGTDLAVVVNSMSSDMSVIDVSDPANPAVVDTVAVPAQVPYGATLQPGTQTVWVTGFGGGGVATPYDVSADATTAGTHLDLPGGAFPLTMAIDAEGTYGFVAHAADHVLSVVDLATGESTPYDWLDATGPMYVAVTP